LALAVAGWSRAAWGQAAPTAPETLAIGDWRLTPVAEARFRVEYRHWLGDEDSGLLVERARIGIDAQYGASLEGRIVLQDARDLDLGRGSHIVGGPLPLAVTGAYEVWGEAHTSSPTRPSYIRIGRQPVTWGEGRLLGSADWLPPGRTLDAVRGRLVMADSAFELLAAVITDPTIAAIAPYAKLFGARAEVAFDPLLALEAYGLARLAQDNPMPSLDGTVMGETYTGALRAHGSGQGWEYGAEGAYQLGHVDLLDENRAAWAAAGHVAYTFERGLLRPELGLGAAYASGDGGGSTYRAFDPLLPDVHTWYGGMDLFAWSNEAEASLRAALETSATSSAALEYRYARLAQANGTWRTGYLATVGAAPGNSHADLGHEVDAVFRWSPWTPVELSVGYSLFLLGDGARAVLTASQIAIPGSVHFAFAQATLRLP
jgi:hypothetical protein